MNNCSIKSNWGTVMEKEDIACEFLHAHIETVERVSSSTPKHEKLNIISELFKVFGDTTRLKILYALFESELCVCDIALIVGMSSSAVSHQLRILKQARLVDYRREGKAVFYSLADEHVRTMLGQASEHIDE